MSLMRTSEHSALKLSQDNIETDHEGSVALREAKPILKRPPLYKVIMHNDDYTPMEFVVRILEYFFTMNREKATQTMLVVHTQGKAVCGIYSRDVAETKTAQVNEFSQQNEHPLMCDIEACEDEDENQ